MLTRVIPEDTIEPLTPQDFAAAVKLREPRGLDYFDAPVAAPVRGERPKPLTTGVAVLKAFEKVLRG